MTTITLLPIRKPARRRGFTLVEIMIGASLSTFILAGVLSTFLFLGRSGANMQNYTDMETQARRGLEIFAEDVRQASSITWNTAHSATIVVNSARVTYAYDRSPRIFSRNGSALITAFTAGLFHLSAFNVPGPAMPPYPPAGRWRASERQSGGTGSRRQVEGRSAAVACRH